LGSRYGSSSLAAYSTTEQTQYRERVPTALDLALSYLRCPICDEAFAATRHAIACPNGHSFDVAKQGYVSLLVGGASAATADTADMVAARERFLSRGHYEPIVDAIGAAIPVDASGACVDLGGGTGYYLARLLDGHPELVGIDLDLSKLALRWAARAHPRLAAVATDAWRPLPIQDAAVGAILSIFSPRNAPEIRRALTPRGRLIVVTPTSRHLVELVRALDLVTVDERKQERLDAQLHDFERLSTAPLEYTLELSREDALDGILMGPSARHVDTAALADRVAAMGAPVHVTVSVNIAVYVAR
jgi:23S rRNA (guanine745-N1)-methyltransferase